MTNPPVALLEAYDHFAAKMRRRSPKRPRQRPVDVCFAGVGPQGTDMQGARPCPA